MIKSNSLTGANPGMWQSTTTGNGASNIDSRWITAIFTVCSLLYISIYAFEAPVRFALFLVGKDSLILLRDGLMIGPLLLLLVAQTIRLQVHPAFLLWAVFLAFHGMVLMGTIGSFVGAVFGAKILMNLLFGFFAASLLTSPEGRALKIMAFIWLMTAIGAAIDKMGVTFPWAGMSTVIGNLVVDISHDWSITESASRRVGGFARSSISIACVLPYLSIAILGRLKNGWYRLPVALIGVGTIFLTTQKGSLVAFTPIALILCLPRSFQLAATRACFFLFLIIAVGLPLLTTGMHLEHGSGVFSTETLAMRITDSWPDAWRWIDAHQMLWFGVGLGGIGVPQRLYAPDYLSEVDNLIVYMYAYFGVFTLLYGAIICFLMSRRVTGSRDRVIPAAAMVAFTVGYGAVLNMLEDPMAPLFLGAALGTLWRETRAEKTARRSVYHSISSSISAPIAFKMSEG